MVLIFAQILFQVFNGARPHMPENLPPAYKRLITDCWQKEPTARPTFPAVHSRLRELYDEATAVRRPDPPEGTLPRPLHSAYSAAAVAHQSPPAIRSPTAA